MSKKWRKRVRGTQRQIGQAFPLTERADKSKLPRGLIQRAYAEPKEEEEPEETEEEMEELYKDIEQAIRREEYEQALEMAKRYQKLKKILETPEDEPLGRIDKLKVALKKVGDKLEELRRQASRKTYEIPEELSE